MLDDVDIEGDDGAEEEGGSWFSRTTGGVRSLSSGVMFLGALFVLFWNEGYSKRHGDALQEIGGQVQTVPMDAINPQLEGKPVHLSARVNSQAGARDDVFGIRTDGAVLYRHVEMFQWVEYEETSGRGRKKKTNYYYEQEWDSEYHDSSQFEEPQGHENPKPALTSDGFFAADARFGPYRFDNEDVARQALNELYYSEEPGSLGNWPKMVDQLPEPSSELAAKRWYQLEPGLYYRGNAASEEAQLGDLSVSFYSFSNDYPLTMVGAQEGEHMVPWKASNGDTILLASGGIRSAAELVKQAEAESGGLTHILRLIGLAGAVIGAAGVASWMGGFLSMIPVVGRLVDMSLKLAGGLFGLMAGLVTIVIGWLSARPWVAAVLLIAIGSAVTWAIRKRREADGAARRSERAGKLAAAARQRAAEALQAATPAAPMALAGAGAGGMPPPPPSGVARFTAAEPRTSLAAPAPAPPPPPPPAAVAAPAPAAAVAEDPKDLPDLEWTPGLIATKPPSVRAATPPPVAPAVAERRPEAPAPGRPAPPTAPAVPAASRSGGADEPRRPTPPAPPSMAASLPGFDMVEAREKPAPLFDSLPQRESSAPLFDTVPMRDSAAPAWSLEDMAEPAAEAAQVAAPAPGPAPTPAPTPTPAVRIAAPESVPAPAKTLRIALGSRGEYALNKLVRQHPDGRQETICFELTQGGKPIKRGTQDEVKEALRQALAGGGG